MRLNSLLPAWLVLAAALLAPIAHADVEEKLFVLRDGRYFVGRVVADDGQSITIEIVDGGIRGRTTFAAAEVVSVSDAKDARPYFQKDPEGKPEAAKPADEVPLAADRWAYIELRGLFGDEVFAVGLERALERAHLLGQRDVVVRIDSEGGEAWAALDCARVLAARPPGMRVHAVVDRAGSCASWVVLACDRRHVMPMAFLGGPPVPGTGLSDDATREAFERRASVELAAIAAAHAVDKPVALGLCDRATRLERVGDGSGVLRIAPERPGLVTDFDGPETYLALSADEAVSLGLASMLPHGVDETALATLLGAEDSVALDDTAQAVFVGQARSARAVADEVFEQVDALRGAIEAFRRQTDASDRADTAGRIADLLRDAERSERRRANLRLDARWLPGELDGFLREAETISEQLADLRKAAKAEQKQRRDARPVSP